MENVFTQKNYISFWEKCVPISSYENNHKIGTRVYKYKFQIPI